jgi:hypothetical protein
MVRRVRCTETPDLLNWQPAPLVETFEPERVKRYTLLRRVSAAVSETLKDATKKGMSREMVAKAMGEWLGEDVSKNTLDRYASETADEHVISAHRLAALARVTGDNRALQVLLKDLGLVAIPMHHAEWITYGQMADKVRQLNDGMSAQLLKIRSGESDAL